MSGMTTNMPNLNTSTVAVQTESQTMSPSALSKGSYTNATSFPGSLFSASIVVEKRPDSGHVALVDKHFPTRVVFSLYFDSATGRKSIRLISDLYLTM